jgi:hypothetical protein
MKRSERGPGAILGSSLCLTPCHMLVVGVLPVVCPLRSLMGETLGSGLAIYRFLLAKAAGNVKDRLQVS